MIVIFFCTVDESILLLQIFFIFALCEIKVIMANEKNMAPRSKGGLKKMASCVGEYKVHAIFTSVLVALEVLFEILIPLIMAQIVNVGMVEDATSFTFTLQLGSKGFELFTMNNRVWFIVTCGAMMIVMALISLFFGTMSGRLAATASTGFAKNLRKKMFYKIENFSFANLDRFKTASLVTRLTTDVTNIQMAFQIIIRMLVRSPIMLILAMCMSISISPDLSLIFAAAIPVLIVGLIVGVKVVFPRFEKMLRKYDDMNESTQENLIGIRAVKAFVREDNEIDKFKKVSSTVQKLQFSAEKIIVIAFPFMQIVIYACMICVAWFGGNDIIVGNMKLGDFTAFLSYIMQILMSLIMVAMGFMNIVLSRASLDRIVEILDEKIDIEDAPDSQDIEVKDGSIDFDNVDFSYSKSRDVLNLENIDLHIRSGETIGIIGGTGSAKSTLVQLIPRLYDVLDGEVKVGGVNVKDYKLDKLRDSVAMVLQKNVLFSGTIRQNLLWGNKDATDEEIEHAAKAAQDFIMSFPDGYETELGQGGVNVSGGQKQRLCIARALLKKPKIMIMDDSTSAVDTATDAAIRSGLKKEFGDTTVLIIAQRISSVEDADRIIVMNDGKIDAVGTHEELLATNEIYRDVYNSQKKGSDEEVSVNA